MMEMNATGAALAHECPSPLISAYLDGELDACEESRFEEHSSACKVCSAALLEQRQLLCLLNSSFSQPGDIEPPADFAKTVTVRAESNVNGLRRPDERLNAYFVIAAFAIFCLFAFFSFADIANPIMKAGDIVAGAATLALHVVTSVYSGVVVIARSASMHFSSQVYIPLLLLLALAILMQAVRRAVLRRG
jgi:anti-sigma factor RsiW